MFDDLLSQMEDALATAKTIRGPKINKEKSFVGNAEGVIDCTKSFGRIMIKCRESCQLFKGWEV